MCSGLPLKSVDRNRHDWRTKKSEHLSIADFAHFCNGCGAKSLGSTRKKKAKNVFKTGGPGSFVVGGAGYSEVSEILPVSPAALLEAAMEEIGVTEVAKTFRGAHVEPDADIGLWASAANAIEDGALVPPDAGAQDRCFAEDFGMIEGDGE